MEELFEIWKSLLLKSKECVVTDRDKEGTIYNFPESQIWHSIVVVGVRQS